MWRTPAAFGCSRSSWFNAGTPATPARPSRPLVGLIGAGIQRSLSPALQRELVAVISKYVSIQPEDIKVHLERQDNLEVLEVKIELPDALR